MWFSLSSNSLRRNLFQNGIADRRCSSRQQQTGPCNKHAVTRGQELALNRGKEHGKMLRRKLGKEAEFEK